MGGRGDHTMDAQRIILPGPEQYWPRRVVGDKVGLILPYGEMTYTVGELDGLTQYFACSLMSPLEKKMTPEQGIHLTDDCQRILLSLPVSDPNIPQAPERRALFARHLGAGCMRFRYAKVR